MQAETIVHRTWLAKMETSEDAAESREVEKGVRSEYWGVSIEKLQEINKYEGCSAAWIRMVETWA